jgi:hypothetical protein
VLKSDTYTPFDALHQFDGTARFPNQLCIVYEFMITTSTIITVHLAVGRIRALNDVVFALLTVLLVCFVLLGHPKITLCKRTGAFCRYNFPAPIGGVRGGLMRSPCILLCSVLFPRFSPHRRLTRDGCV